MKQSRLPLLLVCLPAVLLCSCPLLFMQPLKITAWTPAEKLVTSLDTIEVSVTFSVTPDPVKAEQAFTLAENGAVMEGTYSWNNLRLSFQPYRLFKRGARYTLTVERSAEDLDGNSLAAEFAHTFDTDTDTTRPVIAAYTPQHNAIISGPFTALSITFSEPVLPAAFYSNFSLSPSVTGYYAWSGNYTTCTFTPLTAYTWQTEYTITLAASVTDAAGNSLAREHTTRFFMGTDRTPPAVLSVQNTARTLTLAADLPDDALYPVTAGWESDFGIRIAFSEAVDALSFTAALKLEPDWSYTVQWDDPDNPVTATLQPAERFQYQIIYTLTLAAGLKDLYANATTTPAVYRFHVDGALTSPPQVSRVTCLTQPAGAISSALTPYSGLSFADFDAGQEGFFDIYLDLAQGAAVNLFSFMDAFTISDTNSCVSFTVTRLENSIYSNPQPNPLPDAGINETVVRVYADITDTAARTGLITLQLSTALADKQGSTLQDDWELVLVETP